MLINGIEYQLPYIRVAERDKAQLYLDAISYRMGFGYGLPTVRLAELLEVPGGFVFPHPSFQGFIEWERTLIGVVDYEVLEFDRAWMLQDEG